jgi:hypothetical protein
MTAPDASSLREPERRGPMLMYMSRFEEIDIGASFRGVSKA